MSTTERLNDQPENSAIIGTIGRDIITASVEQMLQTPDFATAQHAEGKPLYDTHHVDTAADLIQPYNVPRRYYR